MACRRQVRPDGKILNTARLLFVVQRYSAMLLGPLVIIHLLVIMYAVRNGLTADEILGRTQGSFIWSGFYLLFVLAVSVHAPIGVRNVLNEWTGLSAKSVNMVCAVLALLMLLTGLRAVLAVT